MRFSIIISVLNIDEILKDCIDSINKQLKNDYYEIILLVPNIFDESKYKFIDDINKKYVNIKLYNIEDDNINKYRNIAIRESLGEYLVFINSFEYFDLEALKKYYEECTKNNLDVLDVDHKIIVENIEMKYSVFSRKRYVLEDVLNGYEYYNYITYKEGLNDDLSRYVFKREFVVNNSLKFYENIPNDTYIFIINSILKANKIKYTNFNLLIKRRYISFASKHYKKYNTLENEIKRVELLSKLINEENIEGIINEILRISYDISEFMDKNKNFNLMFRLYLILENLSSYMFDLDKKVELDLLVYNFRLYKNFKQKRANKLHAKYCNNIYKLNQIINRNKNKLYMDENAYTDINNFMNEYSIYSRFLSYENIVKLLDDFNNGKLIEINSVYKAIRLLQRDLEINLDSRVETYYDFEDKVFDIINNL